jgi:hypothetical protein
VLGDRLGRTPVILVVAVEVLMVRRPVVAAVVVTTAVGVADLVSMVVVVVAPRASSISPNSESLTHSSVVHSHLSTNHQTRQMHRLRLLNRRRLPLSLSGGRPQRTPVSAKNRSIM